ncbi:cytochrome c maturation protein CcmE [Reichenbachiella sp. MALMAid0571]|uniref:cytochrome c maturation protein CcmE domain-containing protein n=1 Tax=Reichenbachiella sp. MALMAid0571 TaxID=3143939 RepID=UPI0032DF5FDE
MKKSHIFGVIIIGVAIMIIISTAGDASTYVTFGEAKEFAQNGDDKKIHVVGSLKKDTNGEVVGLKTSPDMLSFSFQMVDHNGVEQSVIFNEPMPADFLRSEQVVVVGSYNKDLFVASKILMKCPSKYQDETVEISS